MFDRYQAEITVMQFTGHSLSVHQSMTVPLDFTLSHIISQARLRDFFLNVFLVAMDLSSTYSRTVGLFILSENLHFFH